MSGMHAYNSMKMVHFFLRSLATRYSLVYSYVMQHSTKTTLGCTYVPISHVLAPLAHILLHAPLFQRIWLQAYFGCDIKQGEYSNC